MSFSNSHDRRKAAARAEGRGHIIDAHKHSARNRSDLEKSEIAGCFHCCETFSPSEINDWVDDDDCALCPRCGIDAVIPGASGFPAHDAIFLKEMNRFWFS